MVRMMSIFCFTSLTCAFVYLLSKTHSTGGGGMGGFVTGHSALGPVWKMSLGGYGEKK